MKTWAAFAIVTLLAVIRLSAQPADYASLKTEAEKFFADKSYAKSHEVYERAKKLTLATDDKRWVDFRLADTQWRSASMTQRADTTELDKARRELEVMVRDISRNEDMDRVWVEVQESLGDYWWIRRNNQNWGMAWQYYQKALDWWAGAADIELARERYLHIVWTVARPPQVDRWYYYGYYGNTLPLPVLDNALKIAQTDTDKAQAHYLIAMSIRYQGGNWELGQRAPEEFEAAVKFGKGNDWYDDALYYYGEWMMSRGRYYVDDNGSFRQEPDFVKALEMFRQLTADFKKGESRYYDQAKNQINSITGEQLSVSTPNIYLPGSEVQYYLNWRNVKQVGLALYPVNLPKDVQMAGTEERRQYWLQSIDLAGKESIKNWTYDTKDKGEYKPGHVQLRYEGKLPLGAYVLEAKAGGKMAREIILVTESSLVLKTSGRQGLVYFCNALDGAPLANGTVKLWERYYENNRWNWNSAEKQTDKDGLALFDLKDVANNIEIFVSADIKDQQAFSAGNAYFYRPEREQWRIYAFTDRPAYRPKEQVEWKIIARHYDGGVYTTPANESIWFRIDGPDGALVKEGEIKLNEFGSAWGSIELTEAMKLGEYHISFLTQNKNKQIGQAQLFRLEEYKLPEFKVKVETPEVDGKKKIFRVGDTVEANIQADYYFGGPVANASVEVVVYQNPYYYYRPQPREFPWFYEDMDTQQNNWRRWGGRGQIVKRETIKTDAMGKAVISFDTPNNAGQDFEYEIEARVVDASRREITGKGTVRVTRQRYYISADADRNVIAPKDQSTVTFIAQDANNNPVKTEGEVKVVRDYWWEIWIAPDGKEVSGDELKRLQAKSKIWPPLPERPDQRDWQLKFRGYEHEDISKQALKTDAEGKAEFTFKPQKEGYYRITYLTKDEVPKRIAQPINAETTVWVANNATTDTGYRTGGVQLVVDKDTFRVGNEATVMLVANAPNRYVLFSVEAENLYSYRLVKLDGNTKLMHLLIEEKYVPNIYLGAAMVSDRQFHLDSKQVVVPPTKNFLTVEVKPDKEQYQAREKGTLLVTTKNDEGKPVSAEVAVALVDESVYYIQSDYAGDPRQFYYGTKRQQRTQTQSTFNQKRYIRLVEGKDKELLEEEEADRRASRDGSSRQLAEKKEKQAVYESSGMLRGGGVGGGVANYAMDAAATPASMALGASMPAGGPAEMAKRKTAFFAGESLKKGMDKDLRDEQLADGKEPAVQVRNDFRSTIVWRPGIVTDARGQAKVELTYPDSLTGWKATARAVTAGNQLGSGEATTHTKQPLIVRLQAPRFFLTGDQVVVSAVVNNNTAEEMTVKVDLDAAGWPMLQDLENSVLKIPANGEKRADWKLQMGKRTGEMKLKVTARAKKYADAMERTYPVYEHGIEKFITKAGKVRGDDITVRLDIPKERKPESTTLTVQITPSMAVTMLDALPYLINYPYGCTEQTMSRFLPTVITARTMKDMGLQPEDVMGKVFGGVEQANAAATHPNGKKNLERMDDMTKAGLARLYDFQHGDGGWGWWKEGSSDHWMTAYVVWGLTLAKQAGTDIKADVLQRGANYLDKELVNEEESPDMQAWMLHALAVHNAAQAPTKFQQKAFDNLWKKRGELNAYTRALFALSAHHMGKAAEAKTLIENLENGVKRDNRPDTSVLIGGKVPDNAGVIGTAHWGEDGIYWRWSDGGVEATAFALRAMLAIDPKNKLVEPVTNWLIKNRRGAQWNNTRDTAIVVLAMNDYLRVSGELKPEMEYELVVNGHRIAKKEIKGADVFSAPSRFVIDPKFIRDGDNKIQVKRKEGNTPIYFAAEAKFFSLEEPIPAAGNEIFVKREYYKLVGRPTLLKGYVYDKLPLRDGESVKSGERIETVITVETKNNYEYLLFEDLKPAGFEAVAVRSGESLYARELRSDAVQRKHAAPAPAAKTKAKAKSARKAVVVPHDAPDNQDQTGRMRWVYQELRDRQVAMFIDKLPEGVWEIRYDMRAEVPGVFHALPVLGQAMYVPEIRCNGAEQHVTVLEAEEAQ